MEIKTLYRRFFLLYLSLITSISLQCQDYEVSIFDCDSPKKNESQIIFTDGKVLSSISFELSRLILCELNLDTGEEDCNSLGNAKKMLDINLGVELLDIHPLEEDLKYGIILCQYPKGDAVIYKVILDLSDKSLSDPAELLSLRAKKKYSYINNAVNMGWSDNQEYFYIAAAGTKNIVIGTSEASMTIHVYDKDFNLVNELKEIHQYYPNILVSNNGDIHITSFEKDNIIISTKLVNETKITKKLQKENFDDEFFTILNYKNEIRHLHFYKEKKKRACKLIQINENEFRQSRINLKNETLVNDVRLFIHRIEYFSDDLWEKEILIFSLSSDDGSGIQGLTGGDRRKNKSIFFAEFEENDLVIKAEKEIPKVKHGRAHTLSAAFKNELIVFYTQKTFSTIVLDNDISYTYGTMRYDIQEGKILETKIDFEDSKMAISKIYNLSSTQNKELVVARIKTNSAKCKVIFIAPKDVDKVYKL